MQAIDVSVYGPLKKHWNDALNEFAREYKGLAMTRTHFFKVFDRAWKKCVKSKQAIVSGFRKCGLIPFNSDAVAYDRLIAQSPVAPRSTSQVISTEEQVGITRLFQIFEECMSDEWRGLFSRR